jgi:NDP-sugar pyrophosphorylase family protein
MAGGRGERLHPLTLHEPKPLLPVGGTPILEHILNNFGQQGFRRIWISVNYKKELIKQYFGNGESRGLKIKYIEESDRMDSGGALHLAPKFKGPFIVSNADVLVTPPVNYGHLMEHHARSNADATICLGLYQHQVPYGVARFNKEFFTGLDEKPIENFQVNGGIYVFNPEVLDKLPPGPFPMTDLFSNLELSAYPIKGYWQDVGHFEDYARANGNIGNNTG